MVERSRHRTRRSLVALALFVAAAALGAAADSLVPKAFTPHEGSMQSIRGIRGIDTVMLQNLEAVLRMQAPPPPPPEGGGGSVRAAAELLTMENDQPSDPEEETDDRQELIEFELEGS